MHTEKILTEKLVLDKTKLNSLEAVQRLDLWGEGLTDISLVSKLPHLEVLGLAANNVSSLRPLRKCLALQELYLRKNKVANLKEIAMLSGLPKLTVLWMTDNPCAQHEHYRDFVLHCCQALRQLDSLEITAEERKAAAKRLTPKVLDEILGRTSSSLSKPEEPRRSRGSALPTPQEGGSGGASAPTSAVARERASLVDERGRNVLYTTVAAQRAMLLSIVSLLSELTVESLELLQREVRERMEKQKEKVTEFSQ